MRRGKTKRKEYGDCSCYVVLPVSFFTFLIFFLSLSFFTYPYLSLSFLIFPYLSLSFLILPYLSLSFLIFPYLSLSFLIFPYLSLSFLIFPYLSLSFLIFPYLSLSFLIFPYLSLSFLIFPYISLSFLIFPDLSLSILHTRLEVSGQQYRVREDEIKKLRKEVEKAKKGTTMYNLCNAVKPGETLELISVDLPSVTGNGICLRGGANFFRAFINSELGLPEVAPCMA